MFSLTLENKTWIIILALVLTAIVLGLALAVALPELSAVDTVAWSITPGDIPGTNGWVWSG